MTVPGISAIGAAGFTPMVPQTLSAASPVTATQATSPVTAAGAASAASAASGPDFGQLLSNGLQQLQGLNDQQDQLAVQAATGDLSSLHDYTIAATEASVATQLTTAVRNKALESFNEIMRMQI
jgi:flagellar hook-basal body complex protein FliE